MPFLRWIYRLPLRLRSLFRGSVLDRELEQELRYHVEEKTKAYSSRVSIRGKPRAARCWTWAAWTVAGRSAATCAA